MRTLQISLLSLSVLFSGSCRSTSGLKPDSRPVPAPAAAAEPQLWIKVVNVPGWVQAPESGDGGFIFDNQGLEARINISTFVRQQGEPRDAIGWLMVRLAAQGAEIVEMSGDPGGPTARLKFRGGVGDVDVNGLAAAKWSSVEGIGFLVIGLWPAAREPLALPVFELMFESVDISRE